LYLPVNFKKFSRNKVIGIYIDGLKKASFPNCFKTRKFPSTGKKTLNDKIIKFIYYLNLKMVKK